MSDSSKKKNDTKKLGTKTKRAARKAVAGVLLASSLIVAAIPTDHSGVALATATDSYGNEVLDYEGDKALDRNADFSYSSDSAFDNLSVGSNTEYNSYEIRQIDGEWTLLWKYKYFVPDNVGGNTGVGVISDYNDTYNVDTLNMSGQIITGYELIGKSTYDSYVTNTINNLSYILDVSPYVDGTQGSVNGVTGTPVSEVAIYFENEYNEWKNQYDAALANYQAAHPGESPSSLADLSMTPLTLQGNQMTDEMKRIYYCNHNYGNEGTALLTGYTLVPVKNYARNLEYVNSNGVTSTIPDEDTVYVAMYHSNVASDANLDANKFKYLDSQGIIAIGEGAFKDTQKVDVMNVGDGIAYIGNDAFLNSFIKEVQFASVTYIGNRVFKGCQYLEEIHLAEQTTSIGNEAFYGCKILNSVTIPAGVTHIGFGAFADCAVLDTVDFSGSHGVNIGEYAFYNCPYLTQVIFTPNYDIAIGKAAFALAPGSGTNARLTDFVFPERLGVYESAVDDTFSGYTFKDEEGNNYSSSLGDYILANRNNLANVTMPLNFGSSGEEHVPMNTFDMCVDLNSFNFSANNNRNATFDSVLFEDVTNEAFYVFGPETTNNIGSDGFYYALPRRATWKSKTASLDYVPYVYYSDGKNHYEVGIGDYRYELEINDDGTATLLSCEFIVSPNDIPELIVPGTVASYRITDMADGSLDGIKDYIIKLTIADDSIQDIGAQVFADCDKLAEVSLGNSVTTIGDNAFSDNLYLATVTVGENIQSIGAEAFAGCPALENVYWETPTDYALLSELGADAFKTTSDLLYFHGDIESGYQPFEYAMGDNKINDDSVRICYVSPKPSDLSVIMDEETGYVTLIDYPHYYDLPVELRNKYQAGDPLNDEELALLNSTLYLDLPEEIQSIDVDAFLDEDANNENRTNWLYIDNVTNYGDDSFTKHDIYSNENLRNPGSSELLSDYYASGYYPGLFSGYTTELVPLGAYGDPAPSDYDTKGNDWILSVTMPGVTYIPDYAFDSCERLQSVIISEDCTSVGEGAFQGCMDLTSIGTNNNPIYTYSNYIMYKTLSDGSYEIAMCLPARGENRSSSEIWVNTENDPNLSNVTSLQEAAFSSCEYLAKVDLSDTTISDVPLNCFDGCITLNDVELPTTTRNISKDAFANGSEMLDITVPCDSQISDEAFYDESTVTIWTYPECSITSNYEPTNDAEVYIKYLNTTYTITFLNDDLTIYEQIEVESGRNGYYPDNNPAPRMQEHSGYVFDHWFFDKADGIRNVTENRQAIAVFVPAPSQNGSVSNNGGGQNGGNGNGSGSGGGGNNGSGTGNGNGTTSGNNTPSGNNANAGTYNVVVENGAGSGSYRPGQVVTITAYAPTTGRTFDRWTTSNSDIGFSNAYAVSTTFIMPSHDVKVTATYKAATASGNSTSNNNSGSSNNNSNNGGNHSGNSNPSASGNNAGNGSTNVTITTETIDNNNKNLASATVAGSTDNFVVKITDSAYAAAQVEQALRMAYGDNFGNVRYVAFDISLYDATGTRLIENYESLAVTITIPIPDELLSYAGNNKVGVVVNGMLQERAVRFTTIDGVPCMTFTATHFSPYTIYVDTGNLVAGVTDSTPKTGDGIAMKWFLSFGLACGSAVLFLWKDKKQLRVQ